MNSSKPIILFSVLRPITSKFSKSLIEQICILRRFERTHEIVLLHNYKTDTSIKYITEVTGLRIDYDISLHDEYENIVNPKKFKTWIDYYDSIEITKKKVDACYIFGSLLSSACGMNRESNKLDYFLSTWQQMNFYANGIMIQLALYHCKISNEQNIPLNEICYDPCENSLSLISKDKNCYPRNIKCLHGYSSEYFGLTRLDSLNEYLINHQSFMNIHDTKNKIYDVVFGMTVITKNREEPYQKIKKFIDNSPLNIKFLLKHNEQNIDQFISRDSYLELIAQTRFTFITPPYDKNQFSVYRFQESLYNDCLPLIFDDVRIDEFSKSFNVQDRIKELVISYDLHELMSEEKRVELLSYFKEKCLVCDYV